MVRIINYKERITEEGKSFFVLEIQGGIEMVKSQQTGKFYATARKASVASTFDELTCKALIGTEMPGKINKVNCEPYEYTIKETGEIIMLSHRFDYEPDEAHVPRAPKEEISATTFNDIIKENHEKSFSQNGFLVHE